MPLFIKVITAKVKKQSDQKGSRNGFYKHLMNGVSNMLPFVVGGGILIAISFMFGYNSANPDDPSYNPIAAVINGHWRR